MGTLVDRLQQRLIPALLAAVGVSFIAAGLLTYTDPVAATPPSQEPPTAAAETPGPSALLTFPPLVSPSPSTSDAPGPHHVATRVVVPALDIDLPVVVAPDGFPYCGVAMYFVYPGLGQPGDPRPTYLFAHARTGMFLPLLDKSRIDNGRRMLGMLVQVYTSDDQLFLYEVVEVRRHVPRASGMDQALATTQEELWLQTSEGPDESSPKLQLIAKPLSHGPANHADAHPPVNIVHCR